MSASSCGDTGLAQTLSERPNSQSLERKDHTDTPLRQVEVSSAAVGRYPDMVNLNSASLKDLVWVHLIPEGVPDGAETGVRHYIL